jgi:hypothetical protein
VASVAAAGRNQAAEASTGRRAMTEEGFSELPIAWEVAAVDARAEFAESKKLHKPNPHRERFASRELADARKRELQACGMVASVAPVYLGKAAMKAALRKRQVAPFGAFCADWKMAR